MHRELQRIIERALKEDAVEQDITTRILVGHQQVSEAEILVRERAVLSGLSIARKIFKKLDSHVRFQRIHRDGEAVPEGTVVLRLQGKTRALLTGERVALNFLSYLSGIATLTREFVDRTAEFGVHIMDTRKTIPGLRAVVKAAVRHGGGVNHRINLKEMVMIKDNHLIAYRGGMSVPELISRVRRRTKKSIIIEVDDLDQFRAALQGRPDVILLDNMPPAQIRKAVELNRGRRHRCLLEASGGVTLRNVRRIARTGVDRISVGALTHSARAVDFSMEFRH